VSALALAAWLGSTSRPRTCLFVPAVIDTESRRFYNSPTFSDIKLKFPRSKIVIHAHKVILAAGSGFFKRKLLLEVCIV